MQVCAQILSILQPRVESEDATCTGDSKLKTMKGAGGSIRVLDDLAGCANGEFHSPIESYYELADLIIGSQFAEVYIYYRDFNLQKIVEYEATGISGLLAWMGGILGLFFGFSFMTLMEYILLLMDMIFIGIAKLCLKKRNNKASPVSSAHKRHPSLINADIYSEKGSATPARAITPDEVEQGK